MVSDGRIVLRTADGVAQPTAADIVRVEFKGMNMIEGHRVHSKPSEDLPELTIHRFPANIILYLRMPDSTTTNAHCMITAKTKTTEKEIVSMPLPDQIIIDGEWYPLLEIDIEEVLRVLEGAGIPRPGIITLRQYINLLTIENDILIIQQEKEPTHTYSTTSDDIDIGLLRKIKSLGFTAELYEYQRTGVTWLNKISEEELGCILADEMGLGKTVQIIALIISMKEKWHQPSLVIAPATLLENWRREIRKFAPLLDVEVHAGSERTGFPRDLKPHDVVVMSYSTAVRDQAMIKLIQWGFVILDEAQAIKNPDTKRATILKNFPRKVSVAMTGTPLENRLRVFVKLPACIAPC